MKSPKIQKENNKVSPKQQSVPQSAYCFAFVFNMNSILKAKEFNSSELFTEVRSSFTLRKVIIRIHHSKIEFHLKQVIIGIHNRVRICAKEEEGC